MKLTVTRLGLAAAILVACGLTVAAFAAGAPERDCTERTTPRDPLAHPELRRGEMTEQLCLGLDRAPDGRAVELYGGTVEGGRTRDATETGAPDSFLGLRLRLPIN